MATGATRAHSSRDPESYAKLLISNDQVDSKLNREEPSDNITITIPLRGYRAAMGRDRRCACCRSTWGSLWKIGCDRGDLPQTKLPRVVSIRNWTAVGCKNRIVEI